MRLLCEPHREAPQRTRRRRRVGQLRDRGGERRLRPRRGGSRSADRGDRGRRLPRDPAERRAGAASGGRADPLVLLRRRMLFAGVVALPVFLMSMIPALQFDNWQWLSLQLAVPVVLWAGWPFHKAAWENLKHGAATMDTLISVGTLAALLWSLYALFLGDAGQTGMTMPFELLPERGGATDEIYLEVAAVVTAFILAGRYFEARAKRRAGAALQALLELGAKDVSVLDDAGAERRIAIEELRRRPALRGAPRREGGHRRRGRGGPLGDRQLAAHRRERAGGGRARLRGRRRDDQRRRQPDRPGHTGRCRHRPQPDRPPGHRGAVRQGARAAPGRLASPGCSCRS